MFEKVPGTLIISEPDAPANIDLMQQTKLISRNDRDKLLISTVRLLCKPYPGTERICIKHKGQCVSLIKPMSSLFPDIKQVLMYRNCKETVSSFLALLNSNPSTIVSRMLMDSDWLTVAKYFFKSRSESDFIRKTRESEAIHACTKVTNCVGLFTYMWAKYMFVYRDAISHDETILAVKYEDFLSERGNTFKNIFEKLGLDLRHVNEALTAFENDSQGGTLLSRSRIGHTSNYVISDKERIEADVILSSYNLPRMGDDFRI